MSVFACCCLSGRRKDRRPVFLYYVSPSVLVLPPRLIHHERPLLNVFTQPDALPTTITPQPKRIEKAKILIANTSMDTDKIKIFGSRVRVDSMQKARSFFALTLTLDAWLGGSFL